MHPHGHMNLSGHRAKRGKVAAAVMALLKEQDMHGYQIIRELSDRSGGAWNPSPGSIYPALQALEQNRMVSSVESGSKRVFSLTELGRKHADMLPEQPPWDEIAEDTDASRRLRSVFHGLMTATAQVARSDDEQQIEKTTEFLAEARRRIYLMLADEE